MLIWNVTTRCLVVTGHGSVSECGRLSQPVDFWSTEIATCILIANANYTIDDWFCLSVLQNINIHYLSAIVLLFVVCCYFLLNKGNDD